MTETLTPEEAGLGLVPDGPETRHMEFDNIEVRDDGDKIVFQGHAAVFDRLSEDLGGFKERIQRGAFRKVLDSNPDVRLLFNHNPDLVMARSTVAGGQGMLELREDPKGLRTYAELVPTQTAKDLRALVQAGVVNSQSFAFRVDPSMGGSQVWEEVDGQLIRTIVSFSHIFDVGAVVYPAYTQTDASMRSLDANNPGDALRELAYKIHRGEVAATEEQRTEIDAGLVAAGTVSPWIAERALRAASQEPELLAAIPGKRTTVTIEDDDAHPSGQSVNYRLAARQRRLRLYGETTLKKEK